MRKSIRQKLLVAAAGVACAVSAQHHVLADITPALFTLTGSLRNNYTGTVGGVFTTGAESSTINSFGFYDPGGVALNDGFVVIVEGIPTPVSGHRVGLYATTGVATTGGTGAL